MAAEKAAIAPFSTAMTVSVTEWRANATQVLMA